jgi:hypothetical protein
MKGDLGVEVQINAGTRPGMGHRKFLDGPYIVNKGPAIFGFEGERLANRRSTTGQQQIGEDW